jgi:heme-binding NEAT domain protein
MRAFENQADATAALVSKSVHEGHEAPAEPLTPSTEEPETTPTTLFPEVESPSEEATDKPAE